MTNYCADRTDMGWGDRLFLYFVCDRWDAHFVRVGYCA
jgi:hypothetical protein